MKALLEENAVAACWREEVRNAKHTSIAMALVTTNGLAEIRDTLVGRLKQGKGCHFLVGVDLASQPKALADLLELAGEFPSFSVRRFQPSGGQIFHPKFDLFHRGSKPTRAILGSSNMTGNAFTQNYEANVLIDHPGTVKALAGYFAELWEGAYAKPLEEQWLKEYQAAWGAWKELQQHSENVRKQVVKLGKQSLTAPSVPKRIKGHAFAFTGGIAGWPREGKLYPRVRKWKGTVVKEARRLAHAHCLVHVDIPGESNTSMKLKAAKSLGIPIIRVDEFLDIIEQEKALRKSSHQSK